MPKSDNAYVPNTSFKLISKLPTNDYNNRKKDINIQVGMTNLLNLFIK